MPKRNIIVGRDKCLIRTDTKLLEGWESCDDLAMIMAHAQSDCRDDIKEGMHWKGKKMPAELMKQVLGTLAKFPRTETQYILKYRMRTDEWQVVVPPQIGAGESVTCVSEATTDGYAEIGTIHTHPEMGAFWSGTDLRDQQGHFGIHVVFGTRNGKVSQYKCTLFTANNQFDMDLSEFFETVPFNAEYDANPVWEKTIREDRKRAEESKARIEEAHAKLKAEAYAGWGGFSRRNSFTNKHHRTEIEWDYIYQGYGAQPKVPAISPVKSTPDVAWGEGDEPYIAAVKALSNLPELEREETLVQIGKALGIKVYAIPEDMVAEDVAKTLDLMFNDFTEAVQTYATAYGLADDAVAVDEEWGPIDQTLGNYGYVRDLTTSYPEPYTGSNPEEEQLK